MTDMSTIDIEKSFTKQAELETLVQEYKHENGLLYISKARLILENSIIGEDNFPFIVDHPYAKVDIDTLEDFNYAEHLLISKTHE